MENRHDGLVAHSAHRRLRNRLHLSGLMVAAVLILFAAFSSQVRAADPCPYFELPSNEAADWSTCSSCHAPETQAFSESAHSQATCANCHVPERLTSEDGSITGFEVAGCENCHSDQGESLASDIHGETAGLTCTSCHEPHAVAGGSDEIEAATARCTRCHLNAAQLLEGSIHGMVATCSDCHQPHAVRLVEDPRQLAVETIDTCTGCHDGYIKRSYEHSFHGTALSLGEDRIATCIDCHGYHSVDAFAESEEAAVPASVRLTNSCAQVGCHLQTASALVPADYQEHAVPRESTSLPIKFTWKFFIILILFDSIKDGPIVIFELGRVLVNDFRARASRRREGAES